MLSAPPLSHEVESPDPIHRRDVEPESVPAPRAAVPSRLYRTSDLVLIGAVAVLAFIAGGTALSQFRHIQARHRLADEMVSAAAAFRTYLQDHGSLPPNANAGERPAGTATYLAGIRWQEPTPAGGLYRWVNTSTAVPGSAAVYSGAVEVTAFPPGPELKLSAADLRAIDRRIDDGDLATGAFRAGFNGWPVLRLQLDR